MTNYLKQLKKITPDLIRIFKLLCLTVILFLFAETTIRPYLFLSAENYRLVTIFLIVFNSTIIITCAIKLATWFRSNPSKSIVLVLGAALLLGCTTLGILRLAAIYIIPPVWLVNDTHDQCTVSDISGRNRNYVFLKKSTYATNYSVFRKLSYNYSQDMSTPGSVRCIYGTQFLYIKSLNAIIDAKQ